MNSHCLCGPVVARAGYESLWMSPLVIQEVEYLSSEYEESVRLREEVLRKPLGLSFSLEDLQRDADEWHIVCAGPGFLFGCLVLVPHPAGMIQVRQVAIHPEMQRQGIGQALMTFSEDLARERKFTRIWLHARIAAVPFYERLGYEKVGESFVEVTIPHWEMQKLL